MVGTVIPLQLGIPGGPELLIILLIAVLLFGANKIPKLARSTGEAMGEFQKGREQVESELEEMRQGSTGTDTADTADATGGEPTASDAAEAEPTADASDSAEATAADIEEAEETETEQR